jgi:hypothetical protein
MIHVSFTPCDSLQLNLILVVVELSCIELGIVVVIILTNLNFGEISLVQWNLPQHIPLHGRHLCIRNTKWPSQVGDFYSIRLLQSGHLPIKDTSLNSFAPTPG